MKLTLKKGKADKVHIMLDGEYKMTVDSAFVALHNIRDKSEISESELSLLEDAVNSRRAFNKAAELLSRRDHSEKELLQKLRQKGYSAGAEEAAEKLREYGYLDDSRFALSYARELQRLKHFGKRRIEQELMKKGIERSLIAETVEQLEFSEEELVALIERKYQKNLESEKGVQKTVNALLRAGYSYSQIKDALSAFSQGQYEGDLTDE